MMAVLVSVETLLLVLALVLIAGLLRSHAEILRRLGPEASDGAPELAPGLAPVPARGSDHGAAEGRPAPALAGTSPSGDALRLDFARAEGPLTLMAFLTTGCGTCAGFWEGLAGAQRLPDGVQTVIVTRGSEREQPARVRELAPEGLPVIMSSPAWTDYRVPGAPYFVLAGSTILGEGVATTWSTLASLVADAVAEERAEPGWPAVSAPVDDGGASPPRSPGDGRRGAGAARARTIDETLAAGGIGPGHPSLHPTRHGGLSGKPQP